MILFSKVFYFSFHSIACFFIIILDEYINQYLYFSFFRTKWKRQTAVGLELLAEAGNYAALQRLYGSAYGWPYPNQPTAAAAAAALNPAAASVDLYYRQAAAAAALQKPLAYRLYPPGLPLLPTASLQQDALRTSNFPPSDHLRDVLRPELRPEAPRPETFRPEALRLDLFRPDLLRNDHLKLSESPRSMSGGLYVDTKRTSSETEDSDTSVRGTEGHQSPAPTDLRIRVSPEIRTQISPDLRLRVSPDLRLRGSPDAPPIVRPAPQLLQIDDSVRSSSP